MATPGLKSSEMKVTTVAGGAALVPLLMDYLKDGQGMSDMMKIALLAAVTIVVVSYNLGRGLAKTETRQAPPT